jgi:hypothetical protein
VLAVLNAVLSDAPALTVAARQLDWVAAGIVTKEDEA